MVIFCRTVIGGFKRLRYINGKMIEPAEDDPKHGNWEAENILIMNQILKSSTPRKISWPPVLQFL